MDLLLNKYKYSRQRMQHYNNKNNAAGKNSPLLTSRPIKSDVNFTANPFKKVTDFRDVLKKLSANQIDANRIIPEINGVLGGNFFSETLSKAGVSDLTKEADLKKLDSSILRDTARTLSYPFKDLWLDIGNGIATLFRKVGLKKVADDMQKPAGALGKRLEAVEKEKSIELARNIIEKFGNSADSDDIGKYTTRFREDAASGISRVAKNYNSRDERTLNRMTTSTVSALYSAADFYNISMLQKDDKKEAKKAEKGRFKQEMTRMLISAGTTFATLGILDKYLKRDIRINAAVIGLSALLSEVGSRIINKTPLHPLSPEEAAKIAQKRNNNSSQKETSKTNKNNVAFKSNSQTSQIFAKFAQKDGTFTALNSIAVQNAKESAKETTTQKEQSKKKSNFWKYLGLASLGCSAFYLATKGVKGEFSARIARKQLFKGNEASINDFLEKGTPLSTSFTDELKRINSTQKNRADKFDLLAKFKNIVTKKRTEIDLEKLKRNILALEEIDKTDGKIHSILEQYITDIEQQIADNDGNKILNTKTSRTIVEGVYDGVTKVVKTVYQILSIPGAIINGFLEKGLFGKGPFSASEEAFSKIAKKQNVRNKKEVTKELLELDKLFEKHGVNEKTIQQIKRNTRNFETSAETGELANLSRTLVTAISTYFFVNDYGNKVLIESGGKDVEQANQERRERIMHKVANFIFNGTLMNTFNSIFKIPLNNSLTQAALIAAATETTNEFLIRKSICQPIGKKDSKEAILKYEQEQLEQKGFMGWWSRTFKNLTGKKTLSQKAGINNNTNSNTHQKKI